MVNRRRRLAREWLWYVGSIPIAMVLVGWQLIGNWGELTELRFDELILLFLISLLSAIPIYALIGLVRLTGWAFRVVAHPPENRPERPE